MSSDKHLAASQAGRVCRSCGHPVPTLVERHKTMGVYAPLYSDGPCGNRDCPRGRSAQRPEAPRRDLPEEPAR